PARRAPERERPVSADVAIACGIVAGGLHALALHAPGGWAIAWIALVPLLVVVGGRAGARHTAAATIAYAVVLFEAGATPGLAPASARYFGLSPRTTMALTIAGIGVGSVAYGALLSALLARGRPADGVRGIVWCAALWTAWDTLRTWVPPFLPAGVLGVSQVG